MPKTNPTFKDLYDAIGDFRTENAQKFEHLEDKIDSNFVTIERFLPLQKIILGNGKPGLVDRVQNLEIEFQSEKSFFNGGWKVLALASAAFFAILDVVLRLLSMFKIKL